MDKQKRRGKSFLRLLSAQAAFCALLAATAQAAVLTNIEGAVQVNHGDGFKPVAAGAALAPGDRVRVTAGSAAVLYENGCSMRVRPKRIVVVLSVPPVCAATGQNAGAAPAEGPGVAPPPDGLAAMALLEAGTALGIALGTSGSQTAPSVSP